jgi:hypothetical protein
MIDAVLAVVRTILALKMAHIPFSIYGKVHRVLSFLRETLMSKPIVGELFSTRFPINLILHVRETDSRIYLSYDVRQSRAPSMDGVLE